jgi:iron-sulfur cluster assembly protein
MLMLTRDAAEAIKGLAETPGAAGLRIFGRRESPGAEGPGLEIELSAGPQPRDAVVEAEGARLFLAPEAAEAMEDKVLDADVEGGQVRFAVLEQAEGGSGE